MAQILVIQVTNSARFMEALSNGPLLAEELPGPFSKVAARVRETNNFNRDLGSHWRIRGRNVHVPDRITGRRMRAVLYRLVMEL